MAKRIVEYFQACDEIEAKIVPNALRHEMLRAVSEAQEGGEVGCIAWTETRALLRHYPRHHETVEALIARLDLDAIQANAEEDRRRADRADLTWEAADAMSDGRGDFERGEEASR